MSSKQIRISEETYERLARRKREDESFDDVVDRLLNEDRDLLVGFGTADEARTERARRSREQSKQKSKARIATLGRNRGYDSDDAADE